MIKITEKRGKVMGVIEQVGTILGGKDKDVVNENANVSGQEPQGVMSLFAGLVGKEYALAELIRDDRVREAHEIGEIHIHDLDYYASGTTTCLQIPVGDLLRGGFSIKDSYMREPSNITSAYALLAVIFQIHQNMQHGGQAVTALDMDLVPYVKKSYEKYVDRYRRLGIEEDRVMDLAREDLEEEVMQASEAFIHNMNTMTSRGGGQTVFSSVNFGLGTSYESRLISKCLMKAMYNGLGSGEQPIFPILIFQLKDGVNMYPGDPNYDLFEQSLETTAKRFFPNYVFLDASFNLRHYKADDPKTWAASMGCRTRTLEDVNGDARTMGRGNLSFTSMNLPMLALGSLDYGDFLNKVRENAEMICEQLYDRYKYQLSKSPDNFSFIYNQETMVGSGESRRTGNLEYALKHGTLSVGFVGLAEAMVALFGKHHGESEEVLEKAIEVVNLLGEVTERYKRKYSLNYAVIATPAESMAGKALKKTVDRYGVIEGVTDREYFTNSFHVPVWYEIPYRRKIAIEGRFHELCLAGHITYVEVDGMPSGNVEALREIVYAMRDANIGYGAINIPVDKCIDCHYTGSFGESCPKCAGDNIKRIRRITGYLVGDMTRWNGGKEAEERDRVKHM